ncbi:hypothetical protein OW565_11770, partial [Acidithiobacillus ferriphilus]|nr:hypothetical protein [Acidithiobacillus ferriphilus]
QTSTVTPAEPGDFLFLVNTATAEKMVLLAVFAKKSNFRQPFPLEVLEFNKNIIFKRLFDICIAAQPPEPSIRLPGDEYSVPAPPLQHTA